MSRLTGVTRFQSPHAWGIVAIAPRCSSVRTLVVRVCSQRLLGTVIPLKPT